MSAPQDVSGLLLRLFDAEHYRRQGEEAPTVDAALAHFRQLGDRIGLDPSPYFSTRWFKERYPDWADDGPTAFESFLARVCRRAPVAPHPMIDPAYYRAAYPDLERFGFGVALHFMLHGDEEGRQPSEAFDAGFYRRCYLPLGEGHPFRHYIATGRSGNCLPRPVPRTAADSAAAMRRQVPDRPLLLVAHDAQAAGVPLLTLDLARAIRARGWDPVFLLDRAGPLLARFQALGPVFLRAEGWDPAGVAAGLGPGTPALVNTAAAAAMVPALAGAGLRCVVLIHEMADYLRAHGFVEDLAAAKDAGAALIVSMPRMSGMLPELAERLEQILPGVVLPPTPLAAFRAHRRKDDALRRRQAPVFVGAGHADRRKGFDLFLEAAEELRRQVPRARFVWLGALDPWATDLARAAQEGGLALELPGFVEDSLAWYRAADVYLLTSRQDPGPTTAVQAAAMGAPCLGYAADIGLIDLIDRAEGMGLFVPPGDLAALVTQARRLAVGNDPANRRRLRRQVRARTGFDAYVAALLGRLEALPDAAGGGEG